MLECRALSVRYGQHEALHSAALDVAPGEIVVILGANGAGKSTLLQAVAGLVPSDGEIRLDGRSIAGLPPHVIVEAGLALVPEGRRIFGDLTVLENLRLGAYAKRARESEREHLDRVFALFPRLAERRRQIARTMSGGEQQMVAIGRAMMSAPAILMLDEPSLGLSPILCTELFKALAEIRKTGAGILLVEQNARQALAIADRGYLLENGRIVGKGAATHLASDTAVQKAYLGGTPASAMAVTRPATAPPALGADELIRGSIEELTSRAAAIQSEHVRSSRPRREEIAHNMDAAERHREDGALREALAAIEAAAARARDKRE
jgi:branched-chain amino acid transport system ATP-binding protein